MGTNLTLCQSEIFSENTTPDMKVYDALRISISFPLVFEKVCYNNNCYADGGVMANFPIDIFDDDIDKTLGIVVNSKRNISEIVSFDQYLIRILYLLSFQKQELLCQKYKEHSIKITVEYGLLSINFSNKTKKYLIEEGYKQFKDNFDFNKYYKKALISKDSLDKENNLSQTDIDEDIKSLVDEIKDKISVEEKNKNRLNNIINNI